MLGGLGSQLSPLYQSREGCLGLEHLIRRGRSQFPVDRLAQPSSTLTLSFFSKRCPKSQKNPTQYKVEPMISTVQDSKRSKGCIYSLGGLT